MVGRTNDVSRLNALDVLDKLKLGDLVTLVPRESPFTDDPSARWEIIGFSDAMGINVRLWQGDQIVCRRDDVSVKRITAHYPR